MYSVSTSFAYRGVLLNGFEGVEQAIHAFAAGYANPNQNGGPSQGCFNSRLSETIVENCVAFFRKSLLGNCPVDHACYDRGDECELDGTPFLGRSLRVWPFPQEDLYILSIRASSLCYTTSQMKELGGLCGAMEGGLLRYLGADNALVGAEVIVEQRVTPDAALRNFDMGRIVSALQNSGLPIIPRRGEELAAKIAILSDVDAEVDLSLQTRRLHINFRPRRIAFLPNIAPRVARLVERVREQLHLAFEEGSPYR